MNPTISIFDTNVLIQVVANLKVAQTFLLDGFFPNIVESDTQYVSIDVDVGKRRMSPFVSPLVEGRLVEARRIQTNVFEPPYIKDKRAPDLMRPVRRMLGERIAGGEMINGGGPMTAGERMEANLVFELADQVDMLKRRQEWMAAQALVTGKLTVSGDGFPTSTIDFQRDPSLTIVETGTGLWDAVGTTANPTNSVREWSVKILKASGAQITDLIYTNSPYNALIKDDEVKNAILNSAIRANEDTRLMQGPVAAPGAVLMGYWGTYRVWLYNDWYVDDDNVERPMIPDGTVLAVSDQLNGSRAYGAIKDPALGYVPTAYAPKSWMQDDPAQRFLMMQSAPLVIPSRVNACLAATVTSAAD
ncbi:capsid protein of prophage [Gluconobacter frateurii M-2]|nr:capsid protein of prophage [Gluconobacter frateurii M-2]